MPEAIGVASPGLLASHYAPRKPLELVEAAAADFCFLAAGCWPFFCEALCGTATCFLVAAAALAGSVTDARQLFDLQ